MNLSELTRLTEADARQYVESIIWPTGPYCPHCGDCGVTKLQGKSTRPGVYKCKSKGCRKQFTVTVNTIFEDSHIPLRSWLIAFHLMCSSKKGVSALQLQRELGLKSYQSAWHLAHRIRLAMKKEPVASMLGGEGKTVEADEAYVGGKPRPLSGVKAKRGRGTSKKPVAVLVERNGNVLAQPVKRVTSEELKGLIRVNVDPKSKIVTDDFSSYDGIGKEFSGGHSVVNHSAKQYVNRDGEHSNTAESFIALLRRGHYGVFHQLSKRHLHRHTTEFAFRWNHRKDSDGERTKAAIRGADGKRLTHHQPVQDYDACGNL